MSLFGARKVQLTRVIDAAEAPSNELSRYNLSTFAMFCFTVRTHFLPQPDVLQNEETITGPQVSAADTSPSLTEMTFSGPTRGMTVISDVLTCTTLFSVRLRQQQSTAEANGPRFTESTPGCRSTVHPGNSYDRNGSSCGSSFVFRPVLARSLSLSR